MNTTEIKKELYRKKPVATMSHVRKGVLYYETVLNDQYVRFEIPVNDIGDADFYPQMEAHLLIRYLINKD